MMIPLLRRGRQLQTTTSRASCFASFSSSSSRDSFPLKDGTSKTKCQPSDVYARLPERIKRAVAAQIPRDLLFASPREEKKKKKSENTKKTVVAIALSGGVDSFVGAWLLKHALVWSPERSENENNIELKAILMKNWNEREETNSECQFDADRRSAQKLAKYLSIDVHEVDFCREYWQSVFSPFTESVQKGETPNPDVWCNREIKFGKLLEYVKREEIGASYLMTGHYAKVWRGYDDDEQLLKRVELRRAKDETKDQTYFLASVPSKALESVIFPLAELEKATDVVKLIARELLGNVANVLDRKSSAGICFVGKKRNFSDFVHEYVQKDPAWFVDVECITDVLGSSENSTTTISSSSSSSSSNYVFSKCV